MVALRRFLEKTTLIMALFAILTPSVSAVAGEHLRLATTTSTESFPPRALSLWTISNVDRFLS